MKYLSTTITFLLTLIISSLTYAQTCNVDMSINPTGTPGEVQIIDNSTTSSGSAATYSWVDFYENATSNYEGSVSLQPNSGTGTYQFTQNGTYNYYMSVQDSITNCYDSIGGSITINNIVVNCDANFTFNNTVNNVVDFTPDSYNSNLSYHWDFGNGLSTNGPNASHTYVNPGTYNVCLTVWDNTGTSNCADTICQTVNIATNACTISADFSYTSLGNGSYEFEINNITSNTIYSWYIGSGSYSGTNVTHTFTSNGQFNATVIATDTTIPTCQDTVGYSINVTDADTCNYDATFSHVNTVNNQISFSPDNYDPNASYDWNFGDGNYSTDTYPTHTYSGPGTYTVCLTIWDNSSNGFCADTVCETITIPTTNNCDASFNYLDTVNGQTYFLPNNYDQNHSYYWDFGDGNTSNNPFPSHTYSTPGTYTACLSVWEPMSGGQCADTVCQTIVVTSNNVTCDANFYLFQDSTNASIYYIWDLSAGSNLSYSWNFGDGTVSNLQYPSHTYSSPGAYTICLTITDGNGNCTDQTCQTIQVLNKAVGTTINVVPFGQTAGLEEENVISDVKLFPNPTSSAINISLRASIGNNYDYQIIDVMGNQIDLGQLDSNQNVASKEINVEQLQQGVYFVQIIESMNKEKVKTLKFIKK